MGWDCGFISWVVFMSPQWDLIGGEGENEIKKSSRCPGVFCPVAARLREQ